MAGGLKGWGVEACPGVQAGVSLAHARGAQSQCCLVCTQSNCKASASVSVTGHI